MTSHVPLTPENVERLEALIAMNTDSVKGYEEASSLTDDAQLASLFSDIAAARRHNVAVLGGHVATQGGTPDTSGTVTAAVHRKWMDLRTLLQSNERKAILAEIERGERAIKEAYESMIDRTADLPVNAVLREQYREIALQHKRAASLHDAES